MRTIFVGLRLGDAIDPFHLANGFEAVIGYECQERSNHPFSHSYDAYTTSKVSANSEYLDQGPHPFGRARAVFRAIIAIPYTG